MDNYIVRIYRRDRRHPEQLVGMVENVEQESQQGFHTARELLEILLASRPGKRRARTEPRKAKIG
ncbi:MAG TPA: hypothetical protein VEL09_06340 [Burkholderiales bacterium]|nr:hypothetical protein [Burkholderiales bacterium]